MRRVVPLALMHCMFCLGDFDHEEEQDESVMSSYQPAIFPRVKPKTILTSALERNIRYVVTNEIREKKVLDGSASVEEKRSIDDLRNVDVWQVLIDALDKSRERR